MGDQAHRPAARLILVKHGKPRIEPDQPRSEWGLSDAGRAAAASLASKLAAYAPRGLHTSPEPKAHETAAVLGGVFGLTPVVDSHLHEHRADFNPFTIQLEFEALVVRMFAQPQTLVMGEETGRAAHDRFVAAVARIQAEGEGTQAVVAHGRIITLWLSRKLGRDPVTLWRRLGFATAAVLSEDLSALAFVDP